MSIERKSAAIMFTDIAGYTKTMSESEQKALEMLRKKRAIIKPLIDNHKGTYVKEIGDGTLSYFESGYNASSCAKDLQKEIQEGDLNVRIGIHIGDIVFDDDDVYGDGVNIASRIESLAPAGGILISKNVYDELINKDDFNGIPLGLQTLKGVGRLVEVYAIDDDYLVVPKAADYKATEVQVHKDDEVPSIAIIPFENKGADEDVFYAYGISADLISDCSGAGLIRVASLKDVEKLDYNNLETADLSKKLLVRYIAQGTLWKMGEMFQLSIELYDTKDKKVVWSDRWQEKWDNLPTIKGSLSDGLLKALDTKPKIEQIVDTTNPQAYELYLKAKQKYEKRENSEDTEIVQGLLNKAIELDDNLISAKLLLGDTYLDIGDYDKAMEIYNTALKQAEEIGDKLCMGHITRKIGNIQIYIDKLNEGIDCYERSLSIAKEIGDMVGIMNSLNNIGTVYTDKGDYDKALEYFGRLSAIQEEFSDRDAIGRSLGNMGIAHFNKSDHKVAEEYLEKSFHIYKELELDPDNLIWPISYLYLTYKHLGKPFDEKEIQILIKEADNIGFELNFRLYELLEDKSYLEKAYNQIQEKASAMEEELGKKFLSYPIPKAIVEEWGKVK